jgi:hypothetical protein
MGPLRKELTELRGGQHWQQEAHNNAATQAAFARAEEARANRRDARVTLIANSGQMQVRGAQPVSISGVPLALRDARGRTHLLFGEWRHTGNFAEHPNDESAPTTRVQDASAGIDANDALTEHFLKTLDLRLMQSIVEKK